MRVISPGCQMSLLSEKDIFKRLSRIPLMAIAASKAQSSPIDAAELAMTMPGRGIEERRGYKRRCYKRREEVTREEKRL